MLATGATVYAAFPAPHGGSTARAHRHADGRVHAHDAEREAAAWSAPERDASALHGGVHAHDGDVHVHAEAAHSHRTAPETVMTTTSPDGLTPLAGSTVARTPHWTDYGRTHRMHWASESLSVEVPPPIGQG